jgi:hypothetical protein
MSNIISAPDDTAHVHHPWCDTTACHLNGPGLEPTHYGTRHTIAWDDARETSARNPPEIEELGVRVALLSGRRMIDLDVDTATSGSEDAMWLTPVEARRYAEAILAALADLRGTASA